MPSSLIYLGIMLLVIVVWFSLLKRPIYEGVLVSFLLLLTITGTWGNVWTYIDDALSTSLLYTMVAFIAMSIILTETKIIDSCIAIILSLVGRVTGGAGYASVIASAFMGALSGSGPGNVMATGAITIPLMKRTGFPPELAANIESNSSYMGNMIPPSTNIVAALGAFLALYPDSGMTNGQFWMILWGVSFWFIIQRLSMVWAFCKYYKVKPMAKEDLPDFKETLKTGWKGLLLPFIIIVPFILDYALTDGFFTERLGAVGAGYFSKSVLLFVGGIATIYTCLVTKDKKLVGFNGMSKMFAKSVKTIVPSIAVCVFGYMIGSLFGELDVAGEMGEIISAWNFGHLGTVVAICLITCFMGMVVPGSSLTVIFGPMFITVLANAGCDPILAAAMLPCICGVMCGITPPLGLGMYAGMTLAESDFKKTFNNNLWWVAAQFILEVVVLMGWLPIFGM